MFEQSNEIWVRRSVFKKNIGKKGNCLGSRAKGGQVRWPIFFLASDTTGTPSTASHSGGRASNKFIYWRQALLMIIVSLNISLLIIILFFILGGLYLYGPSWRLETPQNGLNVLDKSDLLAGSGPSQWLRGSRASHAHTCWVSASCVNSWPSFGGAWSC